MIEVELMRVGTDAQGNTHTLKSLEAVVADFEPGSLSVTVGFGPIGWDPVGTLVGKVQALRIDGDRVIATVELDADGAGRVTGGMGLASVGQSEGWRR